MANTQHNLSRRQALGGIGVAAVALTPTALVALPTADRSAWNAAVAKYEAATGKMDQAGSVCSTLADAAEAACPRQNEYYSRYNLSHCGSSERNFREAHMSLVIERTKGRHLTEEEARQAVADAQRIVDDFEAYCARHDAAWAEYDKAEKRFDAAVDEASSARMALIEIAAPDNAAFLYKIEMLSAWLTTVESEDAKSINAIRADAQRLLTTGRA